jgi:predicted transcriptional regulator
MIAVTLSIMLDDETKRRIQRACEALDEHDKEVQGAVRVAIKNGVTLEELLAVNRSAWLEEGSDKESMDIHEMEIRAEYEAQGG